MLTNENSTLKKISYIGITIAIVVGIVLLLVLYIGIWLYDRKLRNDRHDPHLGQQFINSDDDNSRQFMLASEFDFSLKSICEDGAFLTSTTAQNQAARSL